MPLKTILLCLTDPDGAEGLIRAACLIARRHGAHLIGLHTVEALEVYPAIAMHIPDAVYAAYGQSQIEQSGTLKQLFEKFTRNEDFVSEWRLQRCEDQSAADRIVDSAHSADLVMMAATTEEGALHRHAILLETVIRHSGRPVLVVPRDFDADELGRTILLGWNDTREAARAAHDALTLLQPGDMAHILRVDEHSHAEEDAPGSVDLAAAFARHGIETNLIHRDWSKPGIAAALNDEARAQGADMIAIGAFGHSRAYDFVIGAASRDLLRHPGLPVLYAR